MKTSRLGSLFLALFLSTAFVYKSNAATITVTGNDLFAGANGVGLNASGLGTVYLKSELTKLLLDELKKQDQLENTVATVNAGGLVFTQNDPNKFTQDAHGCNGTATTNQRFEVYADRDLIFNLTFDPKKLTDPISVTAEIPVHGKAYAHYRQWAGFWTNPFGGGGGWCTSSDVLEGDITATIKSATLKVSMTLNLVPSKGINNTLLFVSSTVSASGTLRLESTPMLDTSNVKVLNSSFLGKPAELGMDVFSNVYLAFQTIFYTFGQGDLYSTVDNKLNSRLLDRARKTQDRVRAKSFAFPTNDEIIARVLASGFQLPYLAEYIGTHAIDLVIALLKGDQAGINTILGSAAACEATRLRKVTLLHQTLYTNVSGSCAAADLDGVDAGRYFTDVGCTQTVAYRPTPYSEFCGEILKTPNDALGNPKKWATPDVATKWTLARGTRLDVGVDSVKNNQAPFLKRAAYRSITTAYKVLSPLDWFPKRISAEIYSKNPSWYLVLEKYSCDLEMRVYKKDITAQNLKPLLALHGGSWKFRGVGFVGLDSQISHLTEQGYIVFMPSYRLAGQLDGNTDCQNAIWSDITSDAEYALGWVKSNGAAYGASNGKVTLFGQSSGAHLAGWLLTHKPTDITKAVLLYPPTDVQDFILNRGSVSPLGVETLEGYLGAKLSDPRILNHPGVMVNSFPGIIAANPTAYPPVFIIHGRADELVPSQQSVRLCNAYTGSADLTNVGPAKNDGGVISASYRCGPSELHMIAQGQHVLDFCIPGVACPAGDAASQQATRDALRLSRKWLSGGVDLTISAVTNSTTTAVAGTTFAVDSTVVNNGTVETGPYVGVHFWLSTDTVIDTTDYFAGSRNAGALWGGVSSSGTTILSTSSVPPGSYYVGAWTDWNNGVVETNESNNKAVALTKITITAP